MATKIKIVYDIAISHMDEIDSKGSTTNSNTRDYENRTPGIITALYPELYQYDSSYQMKYDAINSGDAEYKKRPGSRVFSSMEDVIELDDELCLTVLPYALAAALLADENPALANFLQSRYEEMKAEFSTIGPKVKQPAEWEQITDVYGFCSSVDNATW